MGRASAEWIPCVSLPDETLTALGPNPEWVPWASLAQTSLAPQRGSTRWIPLEQGVQLGPHRFQEGTPCDRAGDYSPVSAPEPVLRAEDLGPRSGREALA